MNAYRIAAALLLAAPTSAHAAGECRYSAEHGANGMLADTRTLSVGEIDQRVLPRLRRLHNVGQHDIRAEFDGALPRLLARAQSEPAAGTFGPGIALRRVECLAAKSARREGAPLAPVHHHHPSEES
jgi:hypothetical protein